MTAQLTERRTFWKQSFTTEYKILGWCFADSCLWPRNNAKTLQCHGSMVRLIHERPEIRCIYRTQEHLRKCVTHLLTCQDEMPALKGWWHDLKFISLYFFLWQYHITIIKESPLNKEFYLFSLIQHTYTDMDENANCEAIQNSFHLDNFPRL